MRFYWIDREKWRPGKKVCSLELQAGGRVVARWHDPNFRRWFRRGLAPVVMGDDGELVEVNTPALLYRYAAKVFGLSQVLVVLPDSRDLPEQPARAAARARWSPTAPAGRARAAPGRPSAPASRGAASSGRPGAATARSTRPGPRSTAAAAAPGRPRTGSSATPSAAHFYHHHLGDGGRRWPVMPANATAASAAEP